jgi:hypothetical protein
MVAARLPFGSLCGVLGVLVACPAAPASPPVMVPMDQVGPQARGVDTTPYAHVLRVAPEGEHRTVAGALASVTDAAPGNRYAILVAAGTYKEARVQMKAYVDLYGGFAAGDWKDRDVYRHATVLDAQKKGPAVLGADHARLDGFVITGGEHKGHGAGVVCDGVSPAVVNNVITGNHTLKPDGLTEGLGKQEASEGAGVALLSGSRAYVSNNLICDNSTDAGAGAGLTARGNVTAKVLRDVFCNNTSGLKDDTVFHGKVGSRSSPGAAIACNAESSPLIAFNVIVLGAALFKNDGGGIWVEGNSMPRIRYNWIAGNTAYDDGGGIYVMGNLYYDEEHKRHDFAPDGPVNIEDNVIAGNRSVYGGLAGVRVSRFGRVDLRRNLIVANDVGGAQGREGGVICVAEDNTIADNGTPREKGKRVAKAPPSPSFRLAGDVTARKFDAGRHVTEIATGKALGGEDLSGSVVRVGGQWSVVKSSGPGGLTVWGKVTDEAPRFEILDRYDTGKLPTAR